MSAVYFGSVLAASRNPLFILTTFAFGYRNFVIDLSSELKACLDSAEQISRRKPSTVDFSAFLNFLRIRDKLLSPDEYAEEVAHVYRPDSDLVSKYNSVYDELVACIARLESAVLAVQRTTDPVMANPADPLPVRVVDGEDEPGGNAADGENPPGGKFSCHLFL
ncbi:hypothetical protein FRC05_006402 [Tulasnella sp. 425]|nr:hypothetical protein FRC05_006402 [Tulasnella sp. 425]